MLSRIALALRGKVYSLLHGSQARRHALVGPPQLWRMKRDFQFRYLKESGLKPSDRLLDIGCGTLRGGVPLIAYLEPGHYTGVEARASVLEEGRKELESAKLASRRPNLVHSHRLGELSLGQSYDIAWAFSVLIHLSDERLEGCLKLVGGHLTDDGRFLANVKLGDGKDGSWQGFPLVARSLEFYRETAARHGMSVTPVGSLRELGHESGQPGQDDQQMLEFRIRSDGEC
jgi:SAM-dependent methyltransferase